MAGLIPVPDRRDFLTSSLVLAGGSAMGGSARAGEKPLLQSQRLPEPKVVFPTDSVPREGKPKRIAAITTVFWKYSHADDIITKFIEGYAVVGRIHNPHCRVVSLYVEQFPDTDIGKGMANRYRIPLCKTPAEALTLGKKGLAVDGVLLIGEHGEYPLNAIGQKLYPRHRLFSEIVKVFQASEKSVPVFNDKHLSYSWEKASWMYEQSRKLKFPLMAGSSVPVAWRRPPLELRTGTKLTGALAIGGGGIESSGFHILEILQAFVERRAGGETGVKAVQCLQGRAAWKAAEEGLWSREILDAILKKVPKTRGELEKVDREATVFLLEYADGFRAACYVSPRHVSEYAVGVKVEGLEAPAATWCYLPKPQRDHFSFLCNHIETMFLSGKPSYPVERTLLTTGALAALMESRHKKGKRIATPHLSRIRYKIAG